MKKVASFCANRGEFTFNVHRFVDCAMQAGQVTYKQGQALILAMDYQRIDNLLIEKNDNGKLYVSFVTLSAVGYTFTVSTTGKLSPVQEQE